MNSLNNFYMKTLHQTLAFGVSAQKLSKFPCYPYQLQSQLLLSRLNNLFFFFVIYLFCLDVKEKKSLMVLLLSFLRSLFFFFFFKSSNSKYVSSFFNPIYRNEVQVLSILFTVSKSTLFTLNSNLSPVIKIDSFLFLLSNKLLILHRI